MRNIDSGLKQANFHRSLQLQNDVFLANPFLSIVFRKILNTAKSAFEEVFM